MAKIYEEIDYSRNFGLFSTILGPDIRGNSFPTEQSQVEPPRSYTIKAVSEWKLVFVQKTTLFKDDIQFISYKTLWESMHRLVEIIIETEHLTDQLQDTNKY